MIGQVCLENSPKISQNTAESKTKTDSTDQFAKMLDQVGKKQVFEKTKTTTKPDQKDNENNSILDACSIMFNNGLGTAAVQQLMTVNAEENVLTNELPVSVTESGIPNEVLATNCQASSSSETPVIASTSLNLIQNVTLPKEVVQVSANQPVSATGVVQEKESSLLCDSEVADDSIITTTDNVAPFMELEKSVQFMNENSSNIVNSNPETSMSHVEKQKNDFSSTNVMQNTELQLVQPDKQLMLSQIQTQFANTQGISSEKSCEELGDQSVKKIQDNTATKTLMEFESENVIPQKTEILWKQGQGHERQKQEQNGNEDGLLASNGGQPIINKGELEIKPLNRTSDEVLPVREQIINQIAARLKTDKSEFVMQLYPKDLGKVTVKMALQNSLLVVELCAVSPKTQSLLLSNADEIKNILQAQYQKDAQILVPMETKEFSHRYQDENSGQPEQQHHSEQKQEKEDEMKQQMFTEGFLSALTALSRR